jgi:hypothetical protein
LQMRSRWREKKDERRAEITLYKKGKK